MNARWDVEDLLVWDARREVISMLIPTSLSGFPPCAICIYLPTFISLL